MILAKNLQIGETYSQEEIAEAFNTSFGYQISGINLRRSEDDQKYMILTKEGFEHDAIQNLKDYENLQKASHS